jgi:hypothetical protein
MVVIEILDRPAALTARRSGLLGWMVGLGLPWFAKVAADLICPGLLHRLDIRPLEVHRHRLLDLLQVDH